MCFYKLINTILGDQLLKSYFWYYAVERYYAYKINELVFVRKLNIIGILNVSLQFFILILLLARKLVSNEKYNAKYFK